MNSSRVCAGTLVDILLILVLLDHFMSNGDIDSLDDMDDKFTFFDHLKILGRALFNHWLKLSATIEKLGEHTEEVNRNLELFFLYNRSVC